MIDWFLSSNLIFVISLSFQPISFLLSHSSSLSHQQIKQTKIRKQTKQQKSTKTNKNLKLRLVMIKIKSQSTLYKFPKFFPILFLDERW